MDSLEISPEFEYISIDQFLDTGDEFNIQDTITTGIIFLTPHQESLVAKLMGALSIKSPDKIERLTNRMNRIESLAASIAQFPSLLERTNTTSSVRTPEALVDSLISYPEDGDTILHMPSKASMGKSFLIAKIHTFFSMYKLARDYTDLPEKEVKEYYEETVSMMFTLMAEDVYLNLLHDKTLEMSFRQRLATSLIILWEHRSDQNMSDIAPVLQSVWRARRTLAPAFGTMMGTSELLLISIQMGSTWIKFIKERLGNQEVSQAMEEFLFGISFEQIRTLRSILKDKGITAISRDEVSKFLGEEITMDANHDYRDFYTMYTIRRDNARARTRMHLEGPHKTLEDYFIQFVMEQNREIQHNGTATE